MAGTNEDWPALLRVATTHGAVWFQLEDAAHARWGEITFEGGASRAVFVSGGFWVATDEGRDETRAVRVYSLHSRALPGSLHGDVDSDEMPRRLNVNQAPQPTPF